MSDIYASVSTTSNLSAGINSKNNLKAGVGNNSSLSASLNPSQSILATGATLGNVTGTILTPAQPNITSLGTLTSLTVSGDVNVSTAPTSGNHLTNKTYVDAQITTSSSSASSSLAAHTSLTNNPHSVTATQVGLGNVTNESKATMFTGPTFTGNPQSNAAPGSGDHLTNKTYVDSQVAGIVDSAPESLNTLNELSAALNDSPAQITDILTAIGQRLVIANNLSDLNDASTARTNLGLGTSNNVTFNSVGINKTPDRTLDMDGHFRLLISPENRISGQPQALIKSTNKLAANLRVVGPVTVTHDLFKESGDTNGFADNSNHFHTIQRINRIRQQPDGEVKNIERVQEQYYAIESNLLRGSNAAFWNWHRVSRSIDNTSVSLTNLTGWNVQLIQNSSNRNNSAQVPFAQSESTTFTFNSASNNPFTQGDLLQIKIDIDFAGAIVAATLFGKVSYINPSQAHKANVTLYGGNYKSTDEVPLGTTQTALTENFSVNKIDTTNKLTLTGNTGLNASTAHQRSFRNLLGGNAYRTGRRVIRLTLNSGHGLELNDVITIITNGNGNYRNAEVAFVKSITTGGSSDFVYVVYGRIFDNNFGTGLPDSYSQSNVIAILKGTLDGLHRINAGDTLMNFNSDNAGRYKSFHIGPGTEVDGNCISIGKNVYNNIDKSIRIAYDPDPSPSYGATPSNHLLITPTYTETLKPLSTTGIQAIRVSGEAESATDLHYDSANHFFRDFDSVPNDMMVIKRVADAGSGGSIGMVGINNSSPKVALHVNGQAGSDGTTNEVFRAIGSGLFTSKNNIALHLKVDTDNNEATGGLGGSTILKLQQDSTNESQSVSERMNLGFIGTGGGGIYTDSTVKAAYIEVENNKTFEIATGNTKSLSINSQGFASFRNRVAIGKGNLSPADALDVEGNIRTSGQINFGSRASNDILMRAQTDSNDLTIFRAASFGDGVGVDLKYLGSGSGDENIFEIATDQGGSFKMDNSGDIGINTAPIDGKDLTADEVIINTSLGIGTTTPSSKLNVSGIVEIDFDGTASSDN